MQEAHHNGIKVAIEIVIPEISPRELQFDLDPESGSDRHELGRGGVGVVYAGRYQHQPVAIKTLYVTTDSVIDALHREAALMFRLTSPYTVKLRGICSSAQKTSLVMERLSGGSLFHLLQNKKQDVPWLLRYRLAYEIAEGLWSLHSQEVLHRDLKSLNVLLDGAQHAKLTDFGFSKLRGQITSVVTSSQHSLGTPAYKAPELVAQYLADSDGEDSDEDCAAPTAVAKKSRPYTPYSDIYAYGVILWELATRKIPFSNKEAPQVYRRIAKGKTEKIPADCPPEFSALIKACWAMKPDERPRTVHIVAQTRALYEAAEQSQAGMDEKNQEGYGLSKIDIPHEYLCPISRDIMQDPVILLDDGFSYDRKSIETYLREGSSDRSPMTGLLLAVRRVRDNINLKKAIQRFCDQNAELLNPDRIGPNPDARVAALLVRQQEEEEQQKLRRRAPFFAYLQHVKAYLQKRQLIGQHAGKNNYDVFISYAWQDHDKKNMEAHRKLQAFLGCLHDDLQRAGLNVFFDCKDMDRNMAGVMQESIAQSGIILSICKPFLQKAVAERPQGNIALEVNCSLNRAEKEPEALLPLLCEGEWDDALPLLMQGKFQLDTSSCQDVRNVFSSFDRHNFFSPAYMDWVARYLIPRVLNNLGVQANDLLLTSLVELFHSQRQRAQLSEQSTPNEQFAHNYPNSSVEGHTAIGLQAFEFSLRCLSELTEFHRTKLQVEDAKDEALPEHQVLFISPSPSDAELTAWITQFIQHLELANLSVIRWSGKDNDLPQQAPRAVIAVCTPDFKKTVDIGFDQQGSSWKQLQQHLAQPNVVCYPIIYQGSYATSVPSWSKNYHGQWQKNFLTRNTEGASLSPSQPYYYELMIGINPKGLLRDLLRYEDNDHCYIAVRDNFRMMQAGWGIKALFDLKMSEQTKKNQAQTIGKAEQVQEAKETEQPEEAVRLFRLAADQGHKDAQFQEAKEAEEPEEAVRLFRLAADQGHKDAQCYLGVCYFEGNGVDEDPIEAARWFRCAADQGHADAQYNLGVCYRNGRGVDVDPVEAVRWFRSSAAQGDKDAEYSLGACYRDGIGVERDTVEAVRWYRCSGCTPIDIVEKVLWYKLAANQGHAHEQYELGICYRDGRGVDRDLAEAVRWLRLAANQRYKEAQYNLGVCYRDGIGVDRDLAEAVRRLRLAANQGDLNARDYLRICYLGRRIKNVRDIEEAMRWLRLIADHGHTAAQYNLGTCYMDGIGVGKDSAEAVRWYRLAANQGHKHAHYNLGVCYRDGIGVEKDSAEAVRWFRCAANQWHKHAQYNLGVCYRDGIGVERDTVEALDWYRLAADQGHAEAQYYLAVCYRDGTGVERDAVEAVDWYRLAADQGHAEAQYYLGVCYRDGIGVDKDPAEAVRCLQLAADQGYEGTKAYLEAYYEGTAIRENAEVLGWLRLAADQGHANAQCRLGVSYEYGKGVDKDHVEAVRWYRLAADQGHAKAQYYLGVCYRDGIGVDKDPAEAVRRLQLAASQGYDTAQDYLKVCYEDEDVINLDSIAKIRWLNLVADQGHAVAQAKMGICYYKGLKVDKNLAEAVRWSRLAADQGNAIAQHNLGVCYENGIGVGKDTFEAVRWYRLAADQGHTGAQNILGICFENGTGIERDPVEASRWFRLAADQGDMHAQYNLGNCYYNGTGVAKNLAEAVRLVQLAANKGDTMAKSNLNRLLQAKSAADKESEEAKTGQVEKQPKPSIVTAAVEEAAEEQKASSVTNVLPEGSALLAAAAGLFPLPQDRAPQNPDSNLGSVATNFIGGLTPNAQQ